MRYRGKPRRGIVILVVLSLLVLFVVLAVTFAIVAGRHRLAAEAQSRRLDNIVRIPNDADYATHSVVRGVKVGRGVDVNGNPVIVTGPAVRYHDMLGDGYGLDGFKGVIAGAVSLAGTSNQFMDIVVSNPSWRIDTDRKLPADYDLSSKVPTAGALAGCVFSVVSGPAKGASTRIVGYDPTTYRLRVVAMRTPSGVAVRPVDLVTSPAVQFVVNGRPFTGTGVGYSSSDGAAPWLDAPDTKFPGAPSALLPNYANDQLSASLPLHAGVEPVRDGGVNEGYDALDHQNMFLAMILPGATSARDIQPSFHRRELVKYFENALKANSALISRVVLRPVPTEHPNFTGSNPNYGFNSSATVGDLLNVLINGPWDVDNDGDGIPDSIWVDVGLGLKEMPDGRTAKPLAAILCLDQDGRLNVNAHDRPASIASVPAAVAIAGGTTAGLPAGHGYGPPEISLKTTFGGSVSNLINQRYGGNGPGVSGLDVMTQVRFFDFPANYFSGTGAAYRSPPDLQGELRMGLGTDGQPRWEQSVLGTADAPFEFDLSLIGSGGVNSLDAPFTQAELERVFRAGDADAAQLPNRLNAIVSSLGAGNTVGRIITTDSFDLPVPNVMHPSRPELMATAGSRAQHVIDLLRDRLQASYTPPPPPASLTKQQGINLEIAKMLPVDVIQGLRMDLNRPFGDGIDNDNNGAIDEPAEAASDQVWGVVFDHLNDGAGARFFAATDLDGDGIPDGDLDGNGQSNALDHTLARRLARQLYARHLYVLALTLVTPPSTTPPPALAHAVAQWAINVVDFRDVDSISTPFEYDPNPFDGWNVDGYLNGYLGLKSTDDHANGDNVVWGCERPELLITKTLAWHDRRTEDLGNDDGSDNPKTYVQGNASSDQDFDQRLRPRSAAFIELYNPWTGTDTQTTPPGDLYTAAPNRGVWLNKTAPGGAPVWRLVVMDAGNPAGLVANPDTSVPAVPAQRGVYFVNANPGMLSGTGDGSRKYFTSQAVAPVLPGQFAIVGSSGVMHNSEHCSFAGRTQTADETTGLEYDYTRRVALIPNANPTVNQVKVYQGGNPPAAAEVPANPAVGIVIDSSDIGPMSLSVSEPLAGYTATDWDPALAANEGAYNTPKDAPLDLTAGTYWPWISANGTHTGFAVVHLQRLADPTQSYHVTGNPYRTIDSASMDLAVFNGLTAFGSAEGTSVGAGGSVRFVTRQRGGQSTMVVNGNERKFWQCVTDATVAPFGGPNSAAESPAFHQFAFTLDHRFGGANVAYVAPPAPPTAAVFPWLTWNNRPFVSQYELMQVSRGSSYEVLRQYDFNVNASPSPYDAANPQFPHLLNWFAVADSTGTNLPVNLYRLLEYAHVPSRFNGTEMILNPTVFAGGGVGTEGFRPPFSRLSNFRDPGRINLNTLMDARVYNALVSGFSAPTFQEFVDSRRGYDIASNLNAVALYTPTATPTAEQTMLVADSTVPTLFGNPFRGPGSGALVPLAAMQRNDIETTLLRSDVVTAPQNQGTPTGQPRFQGTTTNAYDHARRNPYFRYQNLHRLGNLVTTRSHVFAVWVTVGYFEVNASGQLGPEIGIDTGEVNRQRGFYMVDRSIPVAYEPGEDHNVDNCIILRRSLE